MDPDTCMGGSSGRFPETRHSLLAAAREGDARDRSGALDALLRAYWKPVYKYIRLKWRADNEDAKDRTQGFFALASENDFFARYEARKGSFRTYIRTCLDAYLANEHKYARRQRRGGGVRLVPFDFDSAERELSCHEPAAPADFEEFFEKEWIRHLFSTAVKTLEQRRPDLFRLFVRYDLADADRPTYAALADEFDLPVTSVTNHLTAARREFRRIVLAHLRDTTGSEEDFRAEARALLGTDVA